MTKGNGITIGIVALLVVGGNLIGVAASRSAVDEISNDNAQVSAMIREANADMISEVNAMISDANESAAAVLAALEADNDATVEEVVAEGAVLGRQFGSDLQDAFTDLYCSFDYRLWVLQSAMVWLTDGDGGSDARARSILTEGLPLEQYAAHPEIPCTVTPAGDWQLKPE